MACTYDGKEILGAKFDSPAGDKVARVAEIIRRAVTAGVSRTAELAGYTDDLTGEPLPVSACYEQAEGILRSDSYNWYDVLVKHVPDSTPYVYGDNSSYEQDANLCPDCAKDLSFAAIRAGADVEAAVLFEPNQRQQENGYLSSFDPEFVRFRCDVCDRTNC